MLPSCCDFCAIFVLLLLFHFMFLATLLAVDIPKNAGKFFVLWLACSVQIDALFLRMGAWCGWRSCWSFCCKVCSLSYHRSIRILQTQVTTFTSHSHCTFSLLPPLQSLPCILLSEHNAWWGDIFNDLHLIPGDRPERRYLICSQLTCYYIYIYVYSSYPYRKGCISV